MDYEVKRQGYAVPFRIPTSMVYAGGSGGIYHTGCYGGSQNDSLKYCETLRSAFRNSLETFSGVYKKIRGYIPAPSNDPNRYSGL